MRMVITAPYKDRNKNCQFALENVKMVEDGQIDKTIWKPPFWDRIMDVARGDMMQ